MTLNEFSAILIKEHNATVADVRRLNRDGMQAAYDAHIDMYESGQMDGITSKEDFIDYCYFIGRDFVLDNLFDIFKL